MADQVAIQIPKSNWIQNSAFTATAYFRTRSTGSADTPASVKYRIDCLTTGRTVKDWTTVTPASNVSISVTASDNALISAANKFEKKQLTVASDVDATDQHRGTKVWTVEALYKKTFSW